MKNSLKVKSPGNTITQSCQQIKRSCKVQILERRWRGERKLNATERLDEEYCSSVLSCRGQQPWNQLYREGISQLCYHKKLSMIQKARCLYLPGASNDSEAFLISSKYQNYSMYIWSFLLYISMIIWLVSHNMLKQTISEHYMTLKLPRPIFFSKLRYKKTVYTKVPLQLYSKTWL